MFEIFEQVIRYNLLWGSLRLINREVVINKGMFYNHGRSSDRVDNVRHTSKYFFMLYPASEGNVVGMIKQMTTAF
jgi:hypothetical protein